MAGAKERYEAEPLDKAVGHILEEARMVLPGVQALFGFQLIAVFNNRFAEKLSSGEQVAHLVALGLVALAGALIMAPASYHRQVEPKAVSEEFARVATWMVTAGMPALLLGIATDFYLIARIILESRLQAAGAAAALFCLIACLWFVYPQISRRQRAVVRGIS